MGKFVIHQVPGGLNFHLKAVNGETIGTSQVYASEETCLDGIECVMRSAPAALTEDQTISGFKPVKHPKFEIYMDHGEKYRFRLIAVGGKEILASQAYTTKASCQNGIRSVTWNVPGAEIELDES